jgi:uncharacterized membrane protein YdfJ with MMPL/SSD domain
VVAATTFVLFPSAASAKQVTKFLAVGANGRSVSLGGGWSLYQVFLLSRIRERYDETGDTTDAVTFRVASTARIITGAALIIVAVFAGFASGELAMFQQMGFGVAAALLIDATIIRSVVLPSAMKLLGDWNWYLPRRLDWLPRLQVEGEPRELRFIPRPAFGSRPNDVYSGTTVQTELVPASNATPWT